MAYLISKDKKEWETKQEQKTYKKTGEPFIQRSEKFREELEIKRLCKGDQL